ncbi:hypothetical protein H7849_07135 [Alloacidobacterium dinghuense]|uniref:Uncharacterized protein n=1 Tax=Alloacidobacterium dinghuense TaxID=2763107 RepID=A0A7G8BMC2_9BACT|nr:hypothetical protein [Alloacidobacterium dinghuense]QNI33692.1 hypothetical protein H7849_07135 [Alloacidobacterium dinghuense]
MYSSTISRWNAIAATVATFLLVGTTLLAQAQSDMPDAPGPAVQQPAAVVDPPVIPQPKSQREQAAEDLKKEERQRILGIVPDFNMMDNAMAPPLSPKQKFHLFWKSATDPYAFFVAGFVAGYGQAQDSNPGYGQGVEGYFKRFGASYADAFDGNLWGNAILPVWWHEDPRYFRKGTGSIKGRMLHAALSTVWCRRDNGSWGPNYANVVGNMVGGAISNLYYPKEDRGPDIVFGNALTVTAEGAVGAQLVEFWPDILRHYRNKKAKQASAQDASKQTTAQNTSVDTESKQ